MGNVEMEVATTTDARLITPTPGATAFCPGCGGSVIAKCGTIVMWHWAHIANTSCSFASYPETLWHRAWKSACPVSRREVPMGGHFADMVAGDGTVCEVQHSSIDIEELRDRERFYGEMRWIFDARDKGFEVEERGNGYSVHRSHSWPTITFARRRVMLDLGENTIISLEKINESGSYGWGFLYPYKTVRMWLAGPDYREGWNIDRENS